MKKLGKMKLNEFSKTELDQRKLNALKGGCSCGSACACVCAGSGSKDNTSDGVTSAYSKRPNHDY